MNLRIPLLATVWVAFLLAGCDNSKSAAEKEEMKRRIDQLEQEKRESAENDRRATEAELVKAREQLALALEALEKGQPGPGETKKPEIDVKGASRAVVVDETPDSKEEAVEGEDYRIFFKELSKHGEWFATEDYGYMWQPREARVDREWRPYTRGRWLDSDQGWTWASEEPFGWATFHHGRWALLEEHGWAWVPGDQWAPAWVSWRQSNDYIGWAPLPPETLFDAGQRYDARVDTTYDLAPSWYSFVPIKRFQGPVAAHCVPRAEVMQIVVNTENVTRIEMGKDGVYSGGPEPGWVSRRMGSQVSRHAVQRHSEPMADRAQQRFQGKRLELFAPRVRAPWNSAVRPQRVSGSWGRVAVVRGGGAMDPAALGRFRGEMMARHEAARRAMLQEEVREALRQDRLAREEAARLAAAQCRPNIHGQLEEAFKAADLEYESASEALAQRGLTPRQRAYAELALKNADEKFHLAEAAYADHMREFHVEEWARTEGARHRAEAQRQAREERRRQMVCQPSEHERLETTYQAARREVEVTRQAIEEGKLNPRQLAYAKLRLKNGSQNLAAAETSYMDHLLKHHPEDYRAIVREQARAEAEQAALVEQRRTEALAREAAAAEAARRVATEAQARAKAEAELLAAKEAQAKAEAERLATEEAKARAAEADARMEAERQAEAKAEAERASIESKREAAARARAEAELLAAKEAQAKAEGERLAAEEAKARAAEAKARMEAERQARAKAEAERAKIESKREAAARARAEAEAASKAAAEKARVESERLALEEARTEAARVAAEKERQMELERLAAEGAAALEAKALAEQRARDEEASRTPATPAGCSPVVHKQLVASLKAAQEAAGAAQKKVDGGGLNLRQAAYAKRTLGNAVKALNSAQSAWEAHMQEHHPDEWQEILAIRAAEAKKAKEAEEARKRQEGKNGKKSQR